MSRARRFGLAIRVTVALVAVLLLSLHVLPLEAQSLMQDAPRKEAPMPLPQRIFISGHSLMNQPIPRNLVAIASGFGLKLSWNGQYLEGSSIKQRSRGADGQPFSGYTRGVDQANRPVDVLAEFAAAASDRDKRYDALLITEQHGLLGSLVWNDTVHNLRDFQDRFAAQNANGQTYFFEPWLSLDRKEDPRRWIAYERAAVTVWRCVVEKTNMAIAADGRKDRLVSLPAAAALARLIELATAPAGLPGISRANTRATVDSLVQDDVHLTGLGNYYIALVVFAAIFQRSPEGAWRPDEVGAEQALTLQRVAQEFLSQPQPAPLSLDDCRSYVRKSFMWTYLSYAGAVQWSKEHGFLGTLYLQVKVAMQWLWLFSRERPDNPFSSTAYGPG